MLGSEVVAMRRMDEQTGSLFSYQKPRVLGLAINRFA